MRITAFQNAASAYFLVFSCSFRMSEIVSVVLMLGRAAVRVKQLIDQHRSNLKYAADMTRRVDHIGHVLGILQDLPHDTLRDLQPICDGVGEVLRDVEAAIMVATEKKSRLAKLLNIKNADGLRAKLEAADERLSRYLHVLNAAQGAKQLQQSSRMEAQMAHLAALSQQLFALSLLPGAAAADVPPAMPTPLRHSTPAPARSVSRTAASAGFDTHVGAGAAAPRHHDVLPSAVLSPVSAQSPLSPVAAASGSGSGSGAGTGAGAGPSSARTGPRRAASGRPSITGSVSSASPQPAGSFAFPAASSGLATPLLAEPADVPADAPYKLTKFSSGAGAVPTAPARDRGASSDSDAGASVVGEGSSKEAGAGTSSSAADPSMQSLRHLARPQPYAQSHVLARYAEVASHQFICGSFIGAIALTADGEARRVAIAMALPLSPIVTAVIFAWWAGRVKAVFAGGMPAFLSAAWLIYRLYATPVIFAVCVLAFLGAIERLDTLDVYSQFLWGLAGGIALYALATALAECGAKAQARARAEAAAAIEEHLAAPTGHDSIA